MYERYYGVKERPFTLLPDPEFLFLSDKHRAALDMFELAIANHSGICVISGEIGAGKTTLIREILNRLDDSVRVGLVSNTHASFGELMQWVMAAYGLPCDSSDKLELHKQFIDFAIQQYADNRHTLLIIDEAQNLSIASLEELRMLSNVNSDKDFVLQIILVGQHQLRDRLDDPALVQFAQRIDLDYHLEGLSAAETRHYIRHRLCHAGADPELFSACGCGAVYQASKGIPRLINRLCDLCLVYGCTEERARIEAELVNRVVLDQRSGRLLSTCELVDEEQAGQVPVVEQGCRESAATDPATAVPESSEALPDEEVVPATEPDPTANKGGEAMPVAALSAVTPEKLEADGSDAGESIKAMSSALLPQREAPGQSAQERSVASEEIPPAELCELVVNAEKPQQRAAGGERGALWLLVGVLVLAVGAGWMTRDLWLKAGTGYTAPQPVAASRPAPVARSAPAVSEQASKETLETVAEPPQTAFADSRDEAGDGPQLTVATQAPEKDASAVESEETLVLVDKVAQDAEQRQAELEREAEINRQAEQQREAEERRAELEREAEEQRQAELKREAERLARMQEEAERLERQRLETERMLAEQKAAREVLEREAMKEQQRVMEARKAAEKAAYDRALAEQPLSRQQAGQAASPEHTPIKAQTHHVTDSAASVDKTTNPSVGVTTPGDEAIIEPEEGDKPDVRFSNNPCNGPTARFMSTCR